MNIRPETRKQIIKLLGIFLLIAFAFLLFHHHADGDHTHQCFVCRLIQYVSFIFVSIFTLIVSSARRNYSVVPVQRLASFLLTDNRQGRAPPRY